SRRTRQFGFSLSESRTDRRDSPEDPILISNLGVVVLPQDQVFVELFPRLITPTPILVVKGGSLIRVPDHDPFLELFVPRPKPFFLPLRQNLRPDGYVVQVPTKVLEHRRLLVFRRHVVPRQRLHGALLRRPVLAVQPTDLRDVGHSYTIFLRNFRNGPSSFQER